MSENLLNQPIENQSGELLNQSRKVQYPTLGQYPGINQIPYVAMNNQVEFTTNLEEQISKQRQDFLFNFYLQQIIRALTIIIFLLLALMDWFTEIVVRQKRHYYNQHFTFNDYVQRYQWLENDYQQPRYDQYMNWKDSQYYITVIQRWTFWTFFCILIASLILTVVFRKMQINKVIYKINFHLQSVLISFLLIGLTGVDYLESDYGHIMWTSISSMIIIMSFFIVQLANVKYNFLKFTCTNIIQTSLIISFVLNLIRALAYGYIPLRFMIIEILITYPVYYFQQLSQSIMEPIYQEGQSECSINQSFTNFVSNIQVNDKEKEMMKSLPDNYFAIKKIHLKCVISLIALMGLIVLCIFKQQFFILLGILAIQLIGLLFQTQVIPNNKNEISDLNDPYLSACIMLVDLLFPIKNIQRSIERIKKQK